MAKINKIKLSGTSYDIQDLNASKTVELTQAQYDALVTKDPNTFYIITDAQGGDLSNYYTKSETSGATEISTALASKQTTLTAGTGINITDNVISATGGGGKAIEAGSGITITTGTTADTISIGKPFTIQAPSSQYDVENIYIGSNADMYMGSSNSVYGNVAVGRRCTFEKVGTTQSQYNFLGGDSCVVCGSDLSIVFGNGNISYRSCSAVFGEGNIAQNYYEFASGVYNNTSSGSTTFGDSRNVLASFGNGNWGGTRHNALEIRQNGDIYIADTNDTSTSNFYEKPMIKLQDALGGGGGKAIEGGRGISITTGETADTVSFDLPVSAGTGSNSLKLNEGTTASGAKSIAGGQWCTASAEGTIALGQMSQASKSWAVAIGNRCSASGQYSMAVCDNNTAIGQGSFAEGEQTIANNRSEHASGRYNVSNTGSTDADNTLFSVGNGTANNARHNAFEIRKNGDIYCNNGSSDVKLQDYLQIKAVKITESEYAALVTKDENTLYVVVPDPSN